jgi:hypothetical protein
MAPRVGDIHDSYAMSTLNNASQTINISLRSYEGNGLPSLVFIYAAHVSTGVQNRLSRSARPVNAVANDRAECVQPLGGRGPRSIRPCPRWFLELSAQFWFFRTLDDARCGNPGRATTCARLTPAGVDADSVVAVAGPQKSSFDQPPTSMAWFKRRLQFRVAGVEDCGVRVSAFAPRKHVLSRSERRLHSDSSSCYPRNT